MKDSESYLRQPLGRFLDSVASGEAAPGGGSVAAVAVALAAGLASMAARLSTKHFAEAIDLVERAEVLREKVSALADKDAAAYARVLEAQRNDRDSDARRERVRAALSGAADVPLEVARIGAEAAEMASMLVEKGNPNLKGDASTALMLAAAGVSSAVRLVEINLASAGIEDSRVEQASELSEKARAAERRAMGSPEQA